MASTGQGDFSRQPFERGRRYDSVRMQQGRVLLDADWNAEMDLLAHRLRTETRDTIGPAGAPAGAAGFGIEAEGLLSFDGRGRFITLDAAAEDAGEADAAGAYGGDVPPGFTFEARFYPRSGAAPSTLFSRLVWRRAGPGRPGRATAELRLDLDGDGRLALHRAGVEGPLAAAEPVSFDRLNHLAVAYDAGAATIYLNGVAVAADKRGGPLGARGELGYAFGAALDEGEVCRGADGVLLDLCLWRTALDAARVRAGVGGRREIGGDGGAEGLIGAWSFDRPAASVEDRGGRDRRWLLGGGDPAYAPVWVLRQVTIGRGRYYVDGLLCENPEPVQFQRQPDHPGARLPRFARDRVYLFYLDAWELLVTAEQDPGLAEVALGGADTTVRTRVVAQVDVLPLPAEALEDAGRDGVPEAWRSFEERAKRRGRLRARRMPSAEAVGNLLYRVEIHSSGGLYGWPRPLAAGEPVLEAERLGDVGSGAGSGNGAGGTRARLRLAAWPGAADGPWRLGDRVEVWSAETDGAGRAGAAATLVALDPAALTVEIEGLEPAAAADATAAGGAPASTAAAGAGSAGSGAAAAGWLGAASRFRLRRIATFKWSRQNASVLCPLADVEPGGRTVILADPGRRGFEIEAGDWVEYCDAETLLGPPARPLYRVESVDASLLQVTLSGAPIAAGAEAGAYPALRRWDQRRGPADEMLAGGTVVATAGWLPLEAGIEVSFAGDGPYRATDWWSMPARTRTEDIEWPQDGTGDGPGTAGGPAALPPFGVAHRYACLALLAFGDDGYAVRDCRKTFRPLVDGAVSKAGDTMYGPLVIRSSLTVEGAGPEEPGAVAAEVYYGPLGSPDSVTTPNLADRSVTAPKLAPDVGVVPPGYSILGATPEPPPGYSSAGSSFSVFHARAEWRELAPFPRRDPGPLRGAAAAGRLWVTLESGELWEYDPGEGRWSARRPRLEPLQDFAVAALGGRIYVVGGVDPRRGQSGATQVYDPAADRWSAGSEMPTPRRRLALAAAGGKLYALGGLERSWLGERASRANEEYDPEGDQWTPRAPLPGRRYDLGAGAAAGAVHALGGAGRPFFGLWGRTVTNAHDEYEPAAGRWRRSRAALAAAAAHPGVAALEDHLFAAGGEGALGPLAEVAEYDPASGAWSRRPPLPVPAAWVAAGAAGGTLYAAADAAGCPSPPLWELPAASRFYIFRKEAGATPAGSYGADDDGDESPETPGDAYDELAELELLTGVDDLLDPPLGTR